MATINLLPTSFISKGTFSRSAKFLQTIDIIGFIIFALVAIGLMVFYIFNSIRLRDLQAREEIIIANIKKMAQTEQQFVLVRDRLGKIKLVLGEDSINTNIGNVSTLIQKISNYVSVTGVLITPKKSELTILSKDSVALSSYLAELMVGGYFKSIKMTAFNFIPNSGYDVTIQGL